MSIAAVSIGDDGGVVSDVGDFSGVPVCGLALRRVEGGGEIAVGALDLPTPKFITADISTNRKSIDV